MKSSLETLEGNKVKLYVEVEEAEFDRDIDRAFKAIAREVRLPGFRNGKAPRRVLEARIGIAPAREQALREAIPSYLAKAVREHDVDLVATPEIEVTGGTEEGPVEFDATCEVRPEVSVPGYGGLRVELPALHATDDEIDEAIDAERRRHGVPTSVERPAAVGDLVTLDLVTKRDGEEVTGLNTEDWSYEIGQGWITDDFDDQLVGASSGDVLEFTSTPKGTEEPADFTVTVKSVDEMDLPALNDEWVGDNFGEFETVEEWRASQRERIERAEAQPGAPAVHGQGQRGAHGPGRHRCPRVDGAERAARAGAEHRRSLPGQRHRPPAVAVCHGPGHQRVHGEHEDAIGAGRETRPRPACRGQRRGLRGDRRRSRRRVPAGRDASGREGGQGQEGVRAERRRRRPHCPDPQVEGARVVDAQHRRGRHRRQSRSTTTNCSGTAWTTHDHDHDHDHDGAPAVEEEAE